MTRSTFDFPDLMCFRELFFGSMTCDQSRDICSGWINSQNGKVARAVTWPYANKTRQCFYSAVRLRSGMKNLARTLSLYFVESSNNMVQPNLTKLAVIIFFVVRFIIAF